MRVLRQATAERTTFFDRSCVDETITRLGQEPHDFHAIWTTSVATKARFCIVDVAAPVGHASHDYSNHHNRPDDPGPILALGFDASGAVIEEAR